MRVQSGSRRSVGLIAVTSTAIVGVSVVAGIAAAAVGGSLTDLGEGLGGLWGIPALLLTLIAVVLGTAAAIGIARSPGGDGWRPAILVFVGVWVVAIGYTEVAHLVDPCENGWWDADSRIGSQPLCERFGSELNWHTRFHLFAHALPAAILLVLYLAAIRRWGAAPTPRAPK